MSKEKTSLLLRCRPKYKIKYKVDKEFTKNPKSTLLSGQSEAGMKEDFETSLCSEEELKEFIESINNRIKWLDKTKENK